MVRFFAAVLAVWMLSGCSSPTVRHADAGLQPSNREAPSDGGWTFSAAKLDAWIHLQRATGASAQGSGFDGGLGGAGKSVRAEVLSRARFEEGSRLVAGLSEDDVDRIEDLVAALVMSRGLERVTGGESPLDLERALAGLKIERRAEVAAALADLRARSPVDAGGPLSELRQRVGAEPFEALLAREPELTAGWESLLESRGPAR